MRADFLSTMAEASRARVQAARLRMSEAELRTVAADVAAPPLLVLDRFDVIAELKRRSPAQGGLTSENFDATAQLTAYAEGGACAVSVLTEPEQFLGSLEDLRDASRFLAERGIPVMRKDFLTDPYQILEARAAGAGGVLVIVTMLTDTEIDELLAAASENGLFVLLEGFNTKDLERIARFPLADSKQPVLAGVNCRDLKTLAVDFSRFMSLAGSLPARLPAVAESGIADEGDIRDVAAAGYSLALVGSSLMTSDDPASRLAAFITAGREQRAAA
jgi:indole-3-glycerol phosphate synthase